MKDIIINLLTTNTAIGIAVGALVAWLVKWLSSDGAKFKAYEGYAITAVRLAEKAVPDDAENKGVARLNYALQLFLQKYKAATGVTPDEALTAQIESWIATIHNALDAAGSLGASLKSEQVASFAAERREEIRDASDAGRDALRAKTRGTAGAACCLFLALAFSAGCNTATPASKSAAAKANGNTTTVNNYIGMLPSTNGVSCAGGLTISVHDLNGTIAQSADTQGGDRTDLTANPTLAAGVTGDAPMKAIADAVTAFASPTDALSATLSALVKKYGWSAATNALVSAASSCADGSCSDTASE